MKTAWPKTLEVEVSQVHISQGIRQSCRFCPIALAVYAALGCPPEHGISAGPAGILLASVSREQWRWPVPRVVTDFMVKFDTSQPVEPFTFMLKGGRR